MPNKEEKRITEQSSLYEHLEKMSVEELTAHINEEQEGNYEDEARRTRYEVGFYLRFRWSTSTVDARRDLQLCQNQKQPRKIPVI